MFRETNSMESDTSEKDVSQTLVNVKENDKTKPKQRKLKGKGKDKTETEHGVVYLSCIPQSMSVRRLREEMDKYGKTGNIFLQPDEKAAFHRYKQFFTEGWVEFLEKRVAKRVAAALNNTQVGGRRKHPWWADIWNIKYLPKFKWAHLNERLALERAVHEQRLRAEISQVKRETEFHKDNFRKSQKLKDMTERKRKKGEEVEEGPSFNIRQRETEDELLAKKRKTSEEGEGGETKKTKGGRRRERVKKSNHRPDGSHAVGALSLAANKPLLHALFGGGGGS